MKLTGPENCTLIQLAPQELNFQSKMTRIQNKIDPLESMAAVKKASKTFSCFGAEIGSPGTLFVLAAADKNDPYQVSPGGAGTSVCLRRARRRRHPHPSPLLKKRALRERRPFCCGVCAAVDARRGHRL
jgi:hypothetical protein